MTTPRALATSIRQGLHIAGLLLAVTAVGVAGFRILTGGRWLDCLYMTLITLSTVGFEHVVVPSDAVKLFISVYLVLGLSVFTYSAFTLGQLIVSTELLGYWEQRRMNREIGQLRGHYIVCGFGRMGQGICEQLDRRRTAFVVLDNNVDRLAECGERGWLHLQGDATDDFALRRAGLDLAAAVAAVLPTDADNVYVTLSVRMLTPAVRVIARATEQRAAEKLLRAGAERVINPLASGAAKIARCLSDPNMEDFLDIALTHGDSLELADVRLRDTCPHIGLTLRAAELDRRGVVLLYLRRSDGTHFIRPETTAVLQAGDLLVLLGSADAVREATATLSGEPVRPPSSKV